MSLDNVYLLFDNSTFAKFKENPTRFLKTLARISLEVAQSRSRLISFEKA